uniref:Uncharacterized protein n=1 Tax=Amphimedon queenslandica TaxID=400682 RepID=A0A1X7VLI7_AMPQE
MYCIGTASDAKSAIRRQESWNELKRLSQ